MKKIIIAFAATVAAMILFGCQNGEEITDNRMSPQESSNQHEVLRELTEDMVKLNLNESDYFWLHISPQQAEHPSQAYTLKNVSILRHESTKENEELFITANAESPFAVYTGNFIIKYTGNQKSGYELNMVYQDVPGTYEIVAPPTVQAMEELGDDSFIFPPNAERLNTVIQELPGETARYVVRYEYIFDQDGHATVKESMSFYCVFRNGIWTISDQFAQSPSSEIEYHYPPITDHDISNAIAFAIPTYIGTYEPSSGTATTDEKDSSFARISGCKLVSEHFDSSQFILKLEMRCQPNADHTWELEAISASGPLFFQQFDEITLSSTDGDSMITMGVHSLSYDAETGSFVAKVITTDENPRRGGIPAGKAVERIMVLEEMAMPNATGQAYYLRDNSYYIYFDKDMMPLDYAYMS